VTKLWNIEKINHWIKNYFSYTETDKYEIWQKFWHLKQERCEELNELITEAIKWLKKSKEAELDLAKHDHSAEDQFAKLHRIRHRNRLLTNPNHIQVEFHFFNF